jgi:hypothetical protein
MEESEEPRDLLRSFAPHKELRFEPIHAAGGKVIQIRAANWSNHPATEVPGELERTFFLDALPDVPVNPRSLRIGLSIQAAKLRVSESGKKSPECSE